MFSFKDLLGRNTTVSVATPLPVQGSGGMAANGSPVAGNPTLVAGSDATNTRTVLTNNLGALRLGITPTATATGGTNNGDGLNPGGVSGLDTRSVGYVFNGVTIDRLRGDAIGGAYTQERERCNYFAETGGALAANATLTGANRDNGAGSISQWSMFQAMCRSSETGGTLTIQGSDDAVTWSTTGSVVPSVGQVTTLSVPVFYRYYRATYVNGTTAQTALIMRSRYCDQ